MTVGEFRTMQDSMFANMRKMVEGVAKPKNGKAAEPEADRTANKSEPSQPIDRAKERAFNRAIGGLNLSDGAFSRMARDFDAEQPENVSSWVQTYLADFGLGGAGSSSTPGANPTNPAAGDRRPPVTDVPPPAGQAPGDVRDPYALTEDDVAMMIRRDGVHATGTKLMAALRGAPRKRLLVRRR